MAVNNVIASSCLLNHHLWRNDSIKRSAEDEDDSRSVCTTCSSWHSNNYSFVLHLGNGWHYCSISADDLLPCCNHSDIFVQSLSSKVLFRQSVSRQRISDAGVGNFIRCGWLYSKSRKIGSKSIYKCEWFPGGCRLI